MFFITFLLPHISGVYIKQHFQEYSHSKSAPENETQPSLSPPAAGLFFPQLTGTLRPRDPHSPVCWLEGLWLQGSRPDWTRPEVLNETQEADPWQGAGALPLQLQHSWRGWKPEINKEDKNLISHLNFQRGRICWVFNKNLNQLWCLAIYYFINS